MTETEIKLQLTQNNLRNAVNVLQGVISGQTSVIFAQAAVNAINQFLDDTA